MRMERRVKNEKGRKEKVKNIKRGYKNGD